MSDWLGYVDNDTSSIATPEIEPDGGSGGLFTRLVARVFRGSERSKKPDQSMHQEIHIQEEEPAFTLARFEFGVIGRRRKRRSDW